ncbi:Thrombospondin-type laminin G domain and EAR like protein [Argiope bruennichi]|uniref:Thrombospondin-type laminin G domain and EAR like protein n=1 Tax=Argiope bruennichi TaxID=94029 RepID=A0A8T0F0K8_ARGBR|nr:Thrombospondin-type laminin G domain and EAR like protein [Argiope bruennichi]
MVTMWKLCFLSVAWLVHSAAYSQENLTTSKENISSLESEFDKVAEDFLTSFSLAHSKTISRKKRGLDTDSELLIAGGDVYRLQTIVPVSKLCSPAVYSTFLNIDNTTYAICAREATKYTPAEVFVGLYKEHKWYIHWRWYVGNPKGLATFHLNGYIYIFVADNDKEDGIAQLRINIATLTKEEDYIVHSKYPKSIFIWPMKAANYHMAIVNSDGHQHPSDLSSRVFFYEWMGTYFDKYAEFQAYDVKDVEPFHIHGAAYLAIANFRRGINDYEVDSEIMKYNLDKKIWVTHQKIRTYGAMDWEFFSLGTDIGQEFFLAVANKEGGASNIQSVIYKFVKDRFVPFQCLPTPGAVSISSWSSGSIFLLAIANVDAVYLYEYDGWQFVMSGIQYTQGSMSSGVTHLKFNNVVRDYHEVIILSVSNPRQQNELSIFEVGFVKDSSLDDWNKAGTRWCMDAQSNLAASNSDLPLLNDVVFINQPQPITINGSLYFENGFGTDKLKTPRLKEMVTQERYDSEMLLNLQDLQKRLDAISVKIGHFEEVLRSSLQIEGNQTVYGQLQFKDVSFSCEEKSCRFNNIKTSVLNEDIADWRENLVFLDGEQVIDGNLFAENIIANNINVPDKIDGVDSKTLVTKSGNHNITSTKTFANFFTAADLDVGGLVDGMKISPSNILLTRGHQSVTGDLIFKDVDTTWLKVEESVNGINLQSFYEDALRSDISSVIIGKKIFQDIIVSDLTMNDGSTINGIDIPDLWENTLWAGDNQEIKAPMTFQSVALHKNLFTPFGINGVQIPGPRVVTLSGFSNVTAHHVFTTSTTISQLNVLNSLNGIEAFNIPGQLPLLDILLMNGNQVVTGKKTFKTIHLDANSYVKGTVNGVDLSELNDMVLHRDSLPRKRTWTFNNLKIEGPLTVNRISDYDLDSIYANALKLNDTDIPEIIFKDTVFIEELISHDINTIDIARDLILINKPQVITGSKVFQDVVLEENIIIVETFNNVNMTFLTETILRIGNQDLNSKTFSGNVKIDKLTVKGSINNVPVSEFVTLNSNQELLYSRELINVTFREVDAKDIHIAGTVNGIDVDEMMRDTMTYTGPEVINKKIIKGTIHVDIGDDVSIVNINRININDLWEDAVFLDGAQEIMGPKTFKSSVIFNNVRFTSIDGVSEQDLKNWMLKDVPQTVEGNAIFLDGISIKSLYVEGYINGINITELDASIVKINEHNTIEGSIMFDNLVTSKGDIILSGQIQGVDLSVEAVTRSGDKTITGVKTFTQDLIILGDATVDGLVDGILVQELCKNALLVNRKQNISRMTIKGDVTFLGGGTVEGKVSGIDLVKLHDIAVSLDNELTFSGKKTFENLTIEGPIILEGTLGGIDLQILAQTYMSLTQDQIIKAEMKFGELFFEETVSSKKFNTEFQMMNDVNVSNLTRVLRTDKSQTVIAEHFFHKITFHDVFVAGKVNGLNIPEGVMRQNHPNIVESPKVFEKPLHVGNLVIGEGKLIQGVDVAKWFKTAVLNNGSFMIDNYKTFHNLTVINAWVGGLLDGLKVSEENLLMVYGDQIVTGKKTLKDHVDIRGSLTVDGTINGIDLDFLSIATLQRGRTNIITGTKYFSMPLTIQYLEAPTVAGVNLEALERKINTHLDFGQLLSRLQEINAVVDKMSDAIKSQAIVFQYYELFQEFNIPSAYSWLYLFGEDCEELLLLSENSSSQAYCSSIRLFEFYPEQQLFLALPQEIITSYAVSIKSIFTWETTYLFIANQNPNPCSREQITGIGNTTSDIYFWNASSFETYQRLEIPPALDMVVFQEEKLCCAVYIHLHKCTVYCSKGSDQLFELLEILPTTGGRKASVLQAAEGIILAIMTENPSMREIFIDGEMAVDIYFWNSEESTFASPGQVITSTHAQSVLLMSYTKEYSSFIFLVIAEGKIPKVQNEPRLAIYRYDDSNGLFQKYQVIQDYGELDWLVLQTGELILFVLDSQMGKLKMYQHKGASGFVIIDTINSLGSVNIHAFIREVDRNGLHHYVALAGPRALMAHPSQGTDYAKLLKSKVKGNRRSINH